MIVLSAASQGVSVRALNANRINSIALVDKITTVRRSNAHPVVGRLETAALVEFERRLLVFLGFGA
jgi:mRNA interferase MazF